jgi:hypothetical protein
VEAHEEGGRPSEINSLLALRAIVCNQISHNLREIDLAHFCLGEFLLKKACEPQLCELLNEGIPLWHLVVRVSFGWLLLLEALNSVETGFWLGLASRLLVKGVFLLLFYLRHLVSSFK